MDESSKRYLVYIIIIIIIAVIITTLALLGIFVDLPPAPPP